LLPTSPPFLPACCTLENMTNVDASAAAPVETEQPASAMSSTESPATDDGSAPAHTGEGEGDRPLHPTKEAYLPVTSENINKGASSGLLSFIR